LNKPKASLPNGNPYKFFETFGLLDSQLFNVKEDYACVGLFTLEVCLDSFRGLTPKKSNNCIMTTIIQKNKVALKSS
jgi:hypothetical protein